MNIVGSLLLVAAILFHLPNSAFAKETDLAGLYQRLYKFSGVAAHLNNVNDNVQLEALPLLKQCEEQSNPEFISQLLDIELSNAALNKLYLQELTDRLTAGQLEQIMNWANSAAAGRIVEVDRLSGQLSLEQYNALEDLFKKKADKTPQRQQLIKDVLKETGAVYFLSAINTEISALVETVSVCNRKSVKSETLQQKLASVRGDEGFYRTMMRSDVIWTSAVIYQDLSDADLQALLSFAKSDAGRAYHGALIQGLRSMLQRKNTELQQLLFASDK